MAVTTDSVSVSAAARDSQLRIAAYLIEKVHDEFDEELLALCETYAAKHTALRKGLQKLRRKEMETRILDEPLPSRIRSVFDRPFDSTVGIIVFVFTTLLVILSIIGLMMRSVPRYNPTVDPGYEQTWLWIEGAVTIYFTIEFIVRLIAAESKVDHLKRATTVCDGIALLPFYIEVLSGTDINFLQVLRLTRIFVFFRRFRSVDALFRSVWDSVRVLGAPLVFLGTCLFIVSTLLYYTERGTYNESQSTFTISDCDCESSPAFLYGTRNCPRVESKFYSIPHTLWWGVVTLTTVGYGDLVPTCSNGKIVASVSMVLGVLFMAMPIAIVGNYFTLSVRRREEIKAKAFLEKCRQKTDGVKGLEPNSGTESPAVRFLKFLHERLHEPSLSIVDPSPYTMMLLDFYFGTLAIHSHSAPPSVTFELRRVSNANVMTPDPDSRGHFFMGAAPKVSTLNKSVTLIIGMPSTVPGVPPPDVALPPLDAQGVPFRLSQRHAAITLPPQFSDHQPVIRPLPGAAVWVNRELVSDRGRTLRQGDVVDFNGAERPLSYRVEAVHPFALDL